MYLPSQKEPIQMTAFGSVHSAASNAAKIAAIVFWQRYVDLGLLCAGDVDLLASPSITSGITLHS